MKRLQGIAFSLVVCFRVKVQEANARETVHIEGWPSVVSVPIRKQVYRSNGAQLKIAGVK